jgi:hypothetical protein
MTKEWPSTNDEERAKVKWKHFSFVLRHSSFFRHSCFVIRHSL